MYYYILNISCVCSINSLVLHMCDEAYSGSD